MLSSSTHLHEEQNGGCASGNMAFGSLAQGNVAMEAEKENPDFPAFSPALECELDLVRLMHCC